MVTNAEAIAAALADAGIEYAFGLPGGEIAVLIEACRRAGIRFYLTGHEASAAFMADVTGQITGRPGVCLATLGPGAVNLALGVSNALLDRSPVLAITADVSTALAPQFPHQRLRLQQFFGAITKASVAVNGRDTEDLLRRAINRASDSPFGPVHIALPSNLAASAVEPGAAAEITCADETNTTTADFSEAVGILRGAFRPLIVVGLGCRPEDVPALRLFASTNDWPFVVTPKAKGTLSENSPKFLGVVGGMAIDGEIMKTVDDADILLGVGFDPVECDKDWYVRARIVNLSRYPTAEGAYKPVELLGDIGTSLALLRRSLSSHDGLESQDADRGATRTWSEERLGTARLRLRVDAATTDDRSAGLSPLAAIQALREIAPHNTVLTCDVGSHKYYCGQFWRTEEPHTFFMSNGLSGMGYGIPAAIAAKIQFPQRPVISVVGDGGFLMMLHNLTFLRQYRVPITIICFVDASLSLIRVGQRRRGFEPYGVDFPPPDFDVVGKAFGIPASRATSIEALKAIAGGALRSTDPSIIAVPIDGQEYEHYC